MKVIEINCYKITMLLVLALIRPVQNTIMEHRTYNIWIINKVVFLVLALRDIFNHNLVLQNVPTLVYLKIKLNSFVY